MQIADGNMTAAGNSVNMICRVKYKTGQQKKIPVALQIVFLQKQIRTIGSAAEHVKQNGRYEQNFHYPALVRFKGSGFRIKVSGSLKMTIDESRRIN